MANDAKILEEVYSLPNIWVVVVCSFILAFVLTSISYLSIYFLSSPLRDWSWSILSYAIRIN